VALIATSTLPHRHAPNTHVGVASEQSELNVQPQAPALQTPVLQSTLVVHG
jgi:hypothetical protein